MPLNINGAFVYCFNFYVYLINSIRIIFSIFFILLKIWKQKLVQMGATIADRLSKSVSHVFAVNRDALLRQVGREHLERFQVVRLPFFHSVSMQLFSCSHVCAFHVN